MRRATDAFAVLIAVAGFAVSYTTQVALAGEHGFGTWQAWLWPGIADAAALCMILRLHLGQVRPGWYTVEAWLVFAVANTVMVGANTVADRSDPLGGAMHAVVPVVGMLVWHVVIHGRPVQDTTEDQFEDVDDVETTEDIGEDTAGAERPKVPARVLVERLVRRHGQDVTADMVATRTGVSKRHANRLLADARRPKVVGE